MRCTISPLAQVDPRAELGDGVEVGPFCHVGPEVSIGNGCRLYSHVTIIGKTTVGERNRFYPGAVIGADPQDVTYRDAPTRTEIGDENIFREGVTVNRAAAKEDCITRVGNRNFLMANAHVAHNCHVYNQAILSNGVLLGGHVHIQDGAIVSGNSVVHHFATVGTLAFVSGGCRVPHDIPPYMLAAGSENPEVVTINLVGLRRKGVSEETIRALKQAHRLVFREYKKLDDVYRIFDETLDGVFPLELSNLLTFLNQQTKGKQGRAREVFRRTAPAESSCQIRNAA